ncbi:MAG: hypothetical protein ACJAW3_000350 [Lentimonas sp.]|jgi:hypothetical protein
MSNGKIKILVIGGTGATGKLLVDQILTRGHDVKIAVRDASKLPKEIRNHPNISIIFKAVLDMSYKDLQELTEDCDAIASCLGHTISLGGIFCKPRRLVKDSVRRLCEVVQNNNSEKTVKFVLMNSTGCKNLDLVEKTSLAQRLVLAILRLLLPPHVDNEQAGNYLRTNIGENNPAIEWVAVRPDGLIDKSVISPYEIFISPNRSAIFDAGQTSRINVAHFMADLMMDSDIWSKWKGKMPVIYNVGSDG